jgi:hypothetical protein
MELRRAGPPAAAKGTGVAGMMYADTLRTEGLSMQLSNLGPVLRRSVLGDRE